MTLLFGDKNRFFEFSRAHPDTRFQSSGMIERGFTDEDMERRALRQLGLDRTYADYVQQFGEDNARYLMETLGTWGQNYRRIAYIDMRLAPELGYGRQTAEYARRRNWEFETVTGDLRLLQHLLDGDRPDADFLTVLPGQTIRDGGLENVVAAG